MRALIDVRALPDPRYDEAQWSRVRAVAEVLVIAAAQLEQVFRSEGAVDFPAVSTAALRALGTPQSPTDLNLRLDYRLQHVLVDEFQDTSSAQLELIKLLTAGWQRGDGRSIFCVGDPMQSIYGFRQAEVRAFLELAEEGIGEVQFDLERLTSNFRSAQPLVDWTNECFARILPHVDDRARGAIAFRRSECALTAPPTGDSAVHLQGFASRREESSAIAEEIFVQSTLHPQWRIAVLIRARTHATEIASSLRARGVAFRAVQIEPLQDRAVVRDLVMLISGLLHLGDRIAWLAILRAPWAGLTLADLHLIAQAKTIIWEALCDARVLSTLSDDAQVRCARLRLIFDAAFRARTRGTLTRWVEQTWLALGGPYCSHAAQDLEHASRVFARLRDLERLGMPDAADIVHSFSDLFAEHDAAAAVEIMTIHKAKGLEFDMVVVPALDRHVSHAQNQNKFLLLHEFARADRDGMVIAARPGIGDEPDGLFDFLCRRARDAAALEAERLLYVACTRAKQRLLLTATLGSAAEANDSTFDSAATSPKLDAADSKKAWRPRAGSLLAVLWPVAGQDFTVHGPHLQGDDRAQADVHTGGGTQTDGPMQAGAAMQAGAVPLSPRGGPLHRLPAGWSPPAAGNARSGVPVAGSTILREGLPVFDWAGETARRVGSLVHAELHSMDFEGSTEDGIKARAAHYRRWLALHGVPAERLYDAGERVVRALAAVHKDPRGRWIIGRGYRDDFREHELSGHLQGEVVRVVFDRSFIDADGVRWVIDYKTSEHTGGGLDEFLDREVERYRSQLFRYAQVARKLGPEPVKVGLYFPLMGGWREWDPEL